MRYRVKLYSYMRSDVEAFAQKLSVVLTLDVAAARKLLEDVPVVVREGLEEAQANKLRELLTTIGGLSLLEPMEDEDVPAAPPAAQPVAVPIEFPEAQELKERLSSLLWPGLIVGAVAFSVILAVASIWSSYSRMSQSQRPVPRVSQPERTEERQVQPPPEPVKSLAQLYAEIDSTERRLEHLRFLADLKEQEMRAVVGAYRADRDVVRERTVAWEMARAELDSESRKLQELKTALRKLAGANTP